MKMRKSWIPYGLVITGFVAGVLMMTQLMYAMESDAKEATQNIATQAYNEEDGIVLVQLVLENTGEVIHSGSGFFIGTESKHYILTSKSIVTLMEDEKNTYAASLEVEADRINTTVRVISQNGVRWTAVSIDGTENQKFDVLSLSGSVGTVTSLRLAEEYSMETGQTIHVIGLTGNNESTYKEGIIEDWSVNSESEKIFMHNLTLTDTEMGGPVINEHGMVQGLCVRGTDNSIQILQICEITKILATLGIQYNEDLVIDTTRLEEVIALYESLDEKDYTEESWQSSKESYERAKEILRLLNSEMVNNGIQAEADAVAEELNLSIENMEKSGLTVNQIIWIAVIVIVVIIGICVAVIIAIVKRNRKNIAKIEESHAQVKEQALKISGRITPGEIYNTTSMPINRSLAEAQGEKIQETTVLTMVPSGELGQPILKEQQMPPHLIRKKTGDTAYISGHSFVIGKSKEQVDFCISDNPNISRTHACIKMMPDGYYLQDLNATNGTFVDGIKVKWERDVKLKDGSIIKLADEEFVFEWH